MTDSTPPIKTVPPGDTGNVAPVAPVVAPVAPPAVPVVATPSKPLGTSLGSLASDVAEAEADYREATPAVQAVTAAAGPLGTEPAIVLGVLVGVIVAVLAITGVLPVATSVGFVVSLAPVVAAFITRFFVSPTPSAARK